MLKESIVKKHIMNRANGIKSDIETEILERIGHLSKTELKRLLLKEEIYCRPDSEKDQLIDKFVGSARYSVGMKILSMNDILEETTQEYYARIYAKFYN